MLLFVCTRTPSCCFNSPLPPATPTLLPPRHGSYQTGVTVATPPCHWIVSRFLLSSFLPIFCVPGSLAFRQAQRCDAYRFLLFVLPSAMLLVIVSLHWAAIRAEISTLTGLSEPERIALMWPVCLLPIYLGCAAIVVAGVAMIGTASNREESVITLLLFARHFRHRAISLAIKSQCISFVGLLRPACVCAPLRDSRLMSIAVVFVPALLVLCQGLLIGLRLEAIAPIGALPWRVVFVPLHILLAELATVCFVFTVPCWPRWRKSAFPSLPPSHAQAMFRLRPLVHGHAHTEALLFDFRSRWGSRERKGRK